MQPRAPFRSGRAACGADPLTMLENPRRQLLLVLLAIVAGLVCAFVFEVPLGHDLKGGTQLRYEVPQEVLDKIGAKEGVPVARIMQEAISVITERIDPAGVLDPLIAPSGDTGILIELPWFENKQDLDAVLARIANLGKLEMRMVAEDGYLDAAVKFTMAAETQRLKNWLATPENKALIAEDYRNIAAFNESVTGGPLAFGNLKWYPRLIRPDVKDPERKAWDRSFSTFPKLQGSVVKAYEDADYNNGIVPDAMRQKPAKDQFLVEFVALNMKETSFGGEDLDPAGVGPGQHDGRIGVSYSIKASRSGDYAEWSDRHKGKCSAIVLNGVVKSAPEFISKISGNGIITGDFTNEEVDELVKVLKTGSLRVEPELMSRESIGPTLGDAAIRRGAISLVAGAVLVFSFMLFYYRAAGTIACVTLVLNVFLLWAAMLFMQATITLPGLGGIVLTLGMAVDANVLIYERIREELAKGKDLLRAVRAGFDRAMSAILDSNITTLLVGLVLYNVGVGPVRGFAVTLMVGVVTTVFTQFFVTRLLFHYALERNWLADYRPRTLFANLNVDYVRYIKPCVTASALVIVAGLAYATLVAPREITLGIDFTGGANLRVMLATPATEAEVKDALAADQPFNSQYKNVQVNRYGDANPDGTGNQFNIRLKLDDAQRARIADDRKAHRAARTAAEENDQPPPPAYEPPYVAELRRVFAGRLVKPAFSEATLAPAPRETNLQFAMIDVFLQQPVEIAKAVAQMQKGLSQCSVRAIGDDAATQGKDLRIEWKTPAGTKPWEVPLLVQKQIAGLLDTNGAPVSLSEPFPDATEIQGRLVNDLRNAAIGALVIAWLLIVLYLRVRFHQYKYGIAAVVALIHDVLVALVVVVLCNHLGLVHAELNLAMIACFLTIIGYSVNDTIVIFDRIRENATDNARLGVVEPFRALINRALNQTMSRTLLTSGLTLLVVIAQFAVNWGSESDLESFAFAMIIGMVSGVYSTIYIAAPILIWLDQGDLSQPKVEPAPAEAAVTPKV
jgi:protein-export membrane protein SecD/preprotein translocase SecF subunit